MDWRELAHRVDCVYGGYVDYDERFFICPHCAEPIYSYDWEDWDGPEDVCPVCGDVIEGEEDEDDEG